MLYWAINTPVYWQNFVQSNVILASFLLSCIFASDAAVHKCSTEKLFLKILKNLQGNTCDGDGVLFQQVSRLHAHCKYVSTGLESVFLLKIKRASMATFLYKFCYPFSKYIFYRVKVMKSVKCGKSWEMRSFFWPVFSRIRTEDGDLLCKSWYSVRIWKFTDQKQNPHSDTFHAVSPCDSDCSIKKQIKKICIFLLRKKEKHTRFCVVSTFSYIDWML